MEGYETLYGSFRCQDYLDTKKPHQDLTRTVNYRWYALGTQLQKSLTKYKQIQIQKYFRRMTDPDQVGFIVGISRSFIIWTSINVLLHLNRREKKNPFAHLDKCRKSLRQNSRSIHDPPPPRIRKGLLHLGEKDAHSHCYNSPHRTGNPSQCQMIRGMNKRWTD